MQKLASQRLTKRLRDLRHLHGWTQEQAAEACGVGYKLYQLYELGVKANPGLLTLEKLAHGFGLGLDELFAVDLPKSRNATVSRKRSKLNQKG